MSESIKNRSNLLKLSWLPWFLIFFEMLYMASPFAVFFYSAYKMPLKALNSSRIGSWFVQTIFSHFIETKNPLPLILTEAAWPLMIIAIAVFFAAFFQIYYAKFAKKGAVAGGIYKFIRHPQYTAWTVFGFGMCIVWSRLIVWIMFVTMSFIYYFLARAEEKECMKKYDSYKAYCDRTGMFFPKFFKIAPAFTFFPAGGSLRKIAIGALYVTAVLLTVAAGRGLRSWTIAQMTTLSTGNVTAISLNVIPAELAERTLLTVMNDTSVKAELEKKVPADEPLVIYMMPSAWVVPELAMERTVREGENGSNPVGNNSHGNPDDLHPMHKRVLISQAVVNDPLEKNVIKALVAQKPLLIVNVDLEKSLVTKIEAAPERGKYGDIPVPVF